MIEGLDKAFNGYVIYWKAEYERRRLVFIHELEITLAEYSEQTLILF
jgi:hypothetical protein